MGDFTKRRTVRRRRVADPYPELAYCKICGWRKGGTNSWDGSTCRCGYTHVPAPDNTPQQSHRIGVTVIAQLVAIIHCDLSGIRIEKPVRT